MNTSFGTMIRAYRLGWGHSKRHGAFIRMSDFGPGKSLIELCPENAIPKTKSPNKYHRVWWEDPSILNMIPWLQPVRKIKKYVRVIVDDHGTILTGEHNEMRN